METATCPLCRSVNLAGTIRCLTCAGPMELPPIPEGVELDDLPAAPAGPPPAAGWASAVAPGGEQRPLTSGAIIAPFIAVGLVVAFGVLLFKVQFQTPVGLPGGGVTLIELLGPVLSTIVVAAFAFWLWMLIDVVIGVADPGTKVLWVLLIVFLGVPGAIAYAIMGRPSRRSRGVR